MGNNQKGYQIKVSIADFKPNVWRRVIIPHGITYSQLYYIISIVFRIKDLYYADVFEFEYYKDHLVIREGTSLLTFDSSTTFIDSDFEHRKRCRLYIGNSSRSSMHINQFLQDQEEQDLYDMLGFGTEILIEIEKKLDVVPASYPVLVKLKGDNPLAEKKDAAYFTPENNNDQADETGRITDAAKMECERESIQEQLIQLCDLEYQDEPNYLTFYEMKDRPGEFYGMQEPEYRTGINAFDNAHNDIKAILDEYKEMYGDLFDDPKERTPEEQKQIEEIINELKGIAEQRIMQAAAEMEDEIYDRMDVSVLKPDSFESLLMRYGKEDLLEICKDYGISKVSNLKKGELAAKISRVLLSPEMILERIDYLLDEQIDLLLGIAKSDGVYRLRGEERIDADDLEAELFGLVTVNGAFFITPDDVVEKIKMYLTPDIIDKHKKYDWLTDCLTICEWYYIITPIEILLKLFNSRKDISSTEDEIRQILNDESFEKYGQFVWNGDELIPEEAIKAGDFVKQLRKGQFGKAFYIPDEQEIRSFAACLYPVDEPAYIRLGEYIMEKCQDEYTKDMILMKAFIDINEHRRLQDLVDFMEENDLIAESEKELERIVELYVDVHNNTRIAWNRGNKPSDVLMADPEMGGRKNAAAPKEKKVGRNDPCPCGSGKKYKHCCGKVH